MPVERPRSATSFGWSVIAMGVGIAVAALSITHPGWSGSAYAPAFPCLAVVLIIAAAESLGPRRGLAAGSGPSAGGRARDARRIATRVLACGATFGLLALVYWLLPEYHGDFYAPYWRFLRTIAPVALLIPVYFAWMDGRSGERDDYLALGSWLLRRAQPGDGALIQRHLLGWVIKGFFLPLMTVYLDNELRALGEALRSLAPDTLPVYQVFYHLSYTVDLLYCVVGYSVAIRLFDAQVRSVEPTVAGWVVALMCYQPFYSVIGRYYLQYEDGTYWDNWLQGLPVLKAGWAVALIALTSIYALCTVSFGLRFSNLTHRGIITAGPYRYSKHPAYLAKNLSWWLISVPFVSELGFWEAVRNCSLLALLNGVYFLRARTEERHLSRDPTYVAYALWIEEHGLLRRLARRLPFLRYQAPKALPHP